MAPSPLSATRPTAPRVARQRPGAATRSAVRGTYTLLWCPRRRKSNAHLHGQQIGFPIGFLDLEIQRTGSRRAETPIPGKTPQDCFWLILDYPTSPFPHTAREGGFQNRRTTAACQDGLNDRLPRIHPTGHSHNSLSLI